MKSSNTKRKIAETVVGAAVGAAIAGPAGAVAGGLVGSQVAAHTPHPDETKRAPKKHDQDADDPIVHAQLKRILVPMDFSSPSRRARCASPASGPRVSAPRFICSTSSSRRILTASSAPSRS